MPAAVYDALASGDLRDAIARLRVTGIPAHVHATLDFRRVKQLTEAAFHFDLQPDVVRREAAGVVSAALGSLEDEFEGFLAQRALGADRDAVLREAKSLLAAASSGGSS
jgi:hypothetical protein